MKLLERVKAEIGRDRQGGIRADARRPPDDHDPGAALKTPDHHFSRAGPAPPGPFALADAGVAPSSAGKSAHDPGGIDRVDPSGAHVADEDTVAVAILDHLAFIDRPIALGLPPDRRVWRIIGLQGRGQFPVRGPTGRNASFTLLLMVLGPPRQVHPFGRLVAPAQKRFNVASKWMDRDVRRPRPAAGPRQRRGRGSDVGEKSFPFDLTAQVRFKCGSNAAGLPAMPVPVAPSFGIRPASARR